MADEEQAASNEVGENDYNDVEVTPDADAQAVETTTVPLPEDDDLEPIEDYVVNLVVNEQPDLVNALVTDSQGNIVPQQSATLIDSVNAYTTALYDELNNNSTGIAATGKRWWFGWSMQKWLIIGLIALCILGIILAILFLVIGKKFRKNKRSPPTGTTTTTKTVVTKGITTDPKYEPVRSV